MKSCSKCEKLDVDRKETHFLMEFNLSGAQNHFIISGYKCQNCGNFENKTDPEETLFPMPIPYPSSNL